MFFIWIFYIGFFIYNSINVVIRGIKFIERNKMTNTDLKNYMKKHNLTQRELSKILSVEESQISRWVTGATKISRAWQLLLDRELLS